MKKLLLSLGGGLAVFAFAVAANAATITVGNDSNERPVTDTYHNFTIIDTNNSAGFSGELNKFEFYASNTNPFMFVLVDGSGKVMWKSSLITPSTGVNTINETAPVNAGWNVGMYFQSTGTIPFAYNGTADPAYYEPNNAGEPAIGETLSYAGSSKRFYSFVATGTTDSDNDGVDNDVDKCSGTVIDSGFTNPWGVNRWHYDGDKLVQQPNKAVKGTKDPKSLDYTYGCSCRQILDELKDAGLGEFGGHYKFGCSTSILDDFNKDMNDGVLDGRYFVETVTVPANKSADTPSANPLMSGINYILKARGTANAGDNIEFDARYSFRTGSSSSWTDAVSTYEGYGPQLLDLYFNGSTPWGSYSGLHEYEYETAGTGSNAVFKIYDIYYPNNTGNLNVDIYAEL